MTRYRTLRHPASPSISHWDETLSTLKFASRAKRITNTATVNECLDDAAMLRRYKCDYNHLSLSLPPSLSVVHSLTHSLSLSLSLSLCASREEMNVGASDVKFVECI
mmetsp:Transcript_45051/g.97564  ORF Transcript_45051/g.97564 Transcript_45051/m.97564 type:complete len:107 (+) Transcript_45051:53-373(+)